VTSSPLLRPAHRAPRSWFSPGLLAATLLAAGCGRPPEAPDAPPPAPGLPAPLAPASASPRGPDGPAAGSATPTSSGPAAGPATPLGAGWKAIGGELEGKLFESTLREWQRATSCTSFDYGRDGGIQTFWCHRPANLTLASVRALAGVDLFVSGPHKADALTLRSAQAFGHYNPAFVRWLVDHAAPGPHGSPAQLVTREAYEEYMRPLAEVFWRTYRKTRAEEACFAQERSRYAAALARRSLPPGYQDRWYYFMDPAFCQQASNPAAIPRLGDGGVDGNVVKTVMGFWVRRSLDGTMDTFAEGLKKLIAAYQPELAAP
jgi:hypothetical protein